MSPGTGTGTPIPGGWPAGHYITALDVSNWPSGITDADKQTIIDDAESTLEAAIQTYAWPKPVDLRLDGNDRNRLFLPLPAKILTVTGIWLYGILLDPVWWDHDKNSVFISPASGSGSVELDYLLRQVESQGLFPHGIANVRICGTAGEDPVPAWAKRVAKLVAEDRNDPTLHAHKFQGERIGNYSYSRGKEADLYWTGIIEADAIIALHRRQWTILRAP